MFKKYFYTILFFLLSYSLSIAQPGLWTWMGGSPGGTYGTASYGTQGVPSSTNVPPPTYEGLYWTDLQGKFWMYNGNGVSNNVVWKFDPDINQWTWMSGNLTTPNFKMGILGVTSPTACPGDRHFGAQCWTDLQGNFWLGGGLDMSNNLSSDLWKYDPLIMQWTWLRNGASVYGTYGTKGISAATNDPPGISEGKATWTDNSGNLWRFGGLGFNTYEYDNMWKYNISTNEWTWMAGSSSPWAFPSYGTKGVASPTNTPGARMCYAKWKDLSGNLWLFGGYSDVRNAHYNDLWKYDISTNQWTWVNGTNLTNNTGNITANCAPATIDYPAARMENTACWTDSCGNFWMYGGYEDVMSWGQILNDFWVYNPSTNIWTSVYGDPNLMYNRYRPPNTGSLGIPAATNNPGSKAGACVWADLSGNLWLFGGIFNTQLTSDMWRYTPDTACVNSACYVANIPFAAFTYINACIPLSVAFTNTSFNSSIFNWDFGDGQTGSLTNPVHNYSASGTYLVTLISGSGTSADTVSQSITVQVVKPDAQFTTSVSSGCAPLSVSFTNSTTLAGQYLWTFGDGTNSTVTSPSHIYNTAGTYNIQLIATNTASGCTDTTNYTIQVLATAVAGFILDQQFACDTPLVVNFTNVSTSASTYQWDFGNGMSSTNSSPPSQTYNSFGSFTASLIATNAWGCNDTSYQTISITTVPTAGFTMSTQGGCLPLSVNFTNTGSTAANYYWDFGDGGISSASDPSYIFTNEGTFVISLYAINSSACYSVITDTITVSDPYVDFYADVLSSCTIPTNITFVNNSYGASGYLWDFGDGTTSTLYLPTHVYNDTGTYTVSLIGFTSSGCNDTLVFNDYIFIGSSQTDASFTINEINSCDSLVVNFTNTSINATDYQWDFGDGNSSTQINPSNTYTLPGTYSISLITSNNGPCGPAYDTSSVTVVTFAPDSVVNSAFVSDTISGCSPLTINFTNTSSGATNYLWDFGDGDTSNLVDPTHVFNAPGTYLVSLIATNAIGSCGLVNDTSVFMIINVTSPPIVAAAFNADSINGCSPMLVNFTNTSSSATNYVWTLGDGSTSTLTNPSNIYSVPGLYYVSLIATYNGSCGVFSDTSLITTITVTAPPSISSSFMSDSVSGCAPLTLNLTNTSTGATSYLWDFGDGASSILNSPTYTYSSAGTYVIVLTSYSIACGGMSSVSPPLTINILSPSVVTSLFSATPFDGCIPLEVNFINNSTNATIYEWNFGDGSTSAINSPSHIYFFDGFYTVTLISQNDTARCPSSDTSTYVSIVVDSCVVATTVDLFVPNIFTPNNDGKNDAFVIMAKGYSSFSLAIYDRWGLKVFESESKDSHWNGNVLKNNREAPDGTYYYILNLTDPITNKNSTYKGFLTLER